MGCGVANSRVVNHFYFLGTMNAPKGFFLKTDIAWGLYSMLAKNVINRSVLPTPGPWLECFF